MTGVEFEYLQGNTHIAFPFEPVANEQLKRIFADALVIDGSGSDERIRLQSLSIDGDNSTIDAVYIPSETNFFNQTPVAHVYSFGQWLVVQFVGESEYSQILLVLDASKISLPFSQYDLNAVFLAHCVEPAPMTVQHFLVQDEYGTEHRLSGAVDFIAGYNMEIQVDEARNMFDVGSRQATPLLFNAIPGAGMGLVPADCQGDGSLKTINGVGPDDKGRFQLTGEGCYRVWRPALSYTPTQVVFEPATLQMANGCAACCRCEDYGNVYSALQRLYNKGTDVNNALMSLSNGGADVSDEMWNQKTLRAIRKKKLLLRSQQGFVLGVMITFQNNTPGTTVVLFDNPTTIRISGDPDCSDANCHIIEDTIKMGNERFQDWVSVDIDDAFSDKNPDILILKPKTDYDDFGTIHGTEFAVVYFELEWADANEDDEVQIQVENSLFQPEPIIDKVALRKGFS